MSNPEETELQLPPEMAAMPVNDDLGEWPTHGGPLGCLVSMMIGCVLAGFLASTLISFVHFTTKGAGGWFVTGAVVVMLAFLIGFGWLGWIIGKRVYREYPAPQRSGRAKPQRTSAE